MAETFRSGTEGNLEIAAKVWSDFAASIPLIRSFSFGSNFPPQYPIFAGPQIKYHFAFFLAVGLLEKIGIPLVWALNTLSALSFFLLLTLIYLLAKEVFNKGSVAVISVMLFIFNGSFSFLEFFKKHPLSLNTLAEIIQNDTFPSFGPYDGKIISAFWNLNIFTNQRHLALAYAAFLALILIIYKFKKDPKKFTFLKALILGVFVGIFPFIHLAVFGVMGISLLIFFTIYPKLRLKILITGLTASLLALPQILYMGIPGVKSNFFSLGYLVEDLTFINFFIYWLSNLGLSLILVPFAFLLSNKEQRKIFLPFFFLFIIGNLFRFSVEIAANHKLFNLFLIGANIFVASFLVYLWNKRRLLKLMVAVLFFFLTLSGIIDLFPILNDSYFELKDYPANTTVSFIVEKTPKDAVFLNAQFLYDPASLAGRKVYLGWPYFAWSAGYDTDSRFAKMQSFLAASDKESLCSSLLEENIDYIEIQKPTYLEDITINYSFFDNNFA